RTPRAPGHPIARLSRRAGRRAAVGLLVHLHDPARRRPLRVARPAHLVRNGRRMSGAAVPVVLRVPREDRAGAVAYFARRNPRMIIGGALVLMWIFLAVFAPVVAPYDPIKVSVSDSLIAPNWTHLLGT